MSAPQRVVDSNTKNRSKKKEKSRRGKRTWRGAWSFCFSISAIGVERDSLEKFKILGRRCETRSEEGKDGSSSIFPSYLYVLQRGKEGEELQRIYYYVINSTQYPPSSLRLFEFFFFFKCNTVVWSPTALTRIFQNSIKKSARLISSNANA